MTNDRWMPSTPKNAQRLCPVAELISIGDVVNRLQMTGVVLLACPTNCKWCDWHPVTATAICTECLIGSYMNGTDCLREYYLYQQCY